MFTFVTYLCYIQMETSLDHKKFAKRLQKVMDDHQLSAAAFAEKLEVGRATISHLMSGRNKPSLDFIMKVISSFETVDLYWLIYGQIPTSKMNSPAPHETLNFQENSHEMTPPVNLENFIKHTSKPRPIKRVILLMEDGTFESYET